jgi:hypothetical protein
MVIIEERGLGKFVPHWPSSSRRLWCSHSCSWVDLLKKSKIRLLRNLAI